MKKLYFAILFLLTPSFLYIIADLAGVVPPAKKDALTNFGLRSLFVDGKGKTQADWVAHDKTSFSCDFPSNQYGYYCGIDIRVGDGREYGEDLSMFTHVRLKFNLQGDGQHIRVNYRNAFDDISVVPEGKQQDILLTVKEGLNEFSLPLDGFSIPQYWLDKYPGLDQAYLNSERDNVTHMGFFYEEPYAAGTHVFQIIEFSVVNKWVRLLKPIAYIVFSLALLVLVTTVIVHWLKNRPKPLPAEHNGKGDIRLDYEKYLKQQGSELNVYDATTGLLTRQSTIALLDQHAKNHELSDMAILAISLDGFDQLQAEFGESVTWEYRMAAALVVSSCVDKRGVSCNWSDSQILVLLPHIMAPSAKKIADEISYEATVQKFSNDEHDLDMSINVTSIVTIADVDKAFFI